MVKHLVKKGLTCQYAGFAYSPRSIVVACALTSIWPKEKVSMLNLRFSDTNVRFSDTNVNFSHTDANFNHTIPR